MTIWNRQAYLRQAIESIVNQTYPHWQLILWDNNSTDKSNKIGAEYAAADKRITLVTSAENIGHAAALKSALALSNTPYLGWVDSDDILAPTALAETIALLEARALVGMVYTQHTDIDEQGQELGIGYRCLIPYHHNRLLTDFICHHFRLIRRSVYDAVGGVNVDLWQAEDYDLCLRLSEITQVAQIHKPLYYYRVHAEALSQSNQAGQIAHAAAAVRAALIRRGYDPIYKLVTEGGFRLELKSTQADAVDE
jgi:glycosyltransferase involved in cell wall biosynthesis